MTFLMHGLLIRIDPLFFGNSKLTGLDVVIPLLEITEGVGPLGHIIIKYGFSSK